MKVFKITYRETNAFSRLALDYLDQKPGLRKLFRYLPQIDSFQEVIKNRLALNTDRALLVKTLQEQYNGLSVHEAVDSNIQHLESEKTFTVTTAHQPLLFGGPMYFVTKILSTISLARHLSDAYPDQRFVPVYWLGGEDHDFLEINHAHVRGKRLEWHMETATGAVGQLKMEGVQRLLDEFQQLLGESPATRKISALFRDAYSPENTLAAATRQWLNALFGHLGLVIVDGNYPALKKQFVPTMLREVLHRKTPRVLEPALAFLRENYHVQANPREINLFYMLDDIRERLVYNEADNVFEVLNTSLVFTPETLQDEISNCPERFSPNVILRPLYQETILPNLACVGGGGELAYWLELKDLFGYHGVPYPVVLLRDSFLFLNRPGTKTMESIGFQPSDLFLDEEEMIKKHLKTLSGEQVNLPEEKLKANELFNSILNKALAIDLTLKQPVEGERTRFLHSLEKLESRMLKAVKRKNEEAIQRIRNLKQQVMPDGILQERHENFAPFYTRYGEAFFEIILNNANPLEGSFKVIVENSF